MAASSRTQEYRQMSQWAMLLGLELVEVVEGIL